MSNQHSQGNSRQKYVSNYFGLAIRQRRTHCEAHTQFLQRLLMIWLMLALPPWVLAAQQDLVGPSGSGAFGNLVKALPNGNFVVTDPEFDLQNPTVTDVGAVYLYSPDGEIISRLTGSQAHDKVGSGGVKGLANGHFTVFSRDWGNQRGAVTWGSATRGVEGVVSLANSLVGTSGGLSLVTVLRNGNYVVSSNHWSSATAQSAGAVTWCNGATGSAVGEVSAINSLVGSQSYDFVGAELGVSPSIIELSNGNFLVRSSNWSNRDIQGAGAVTWVNGNSGLTGAVSAANSLVGTSHADKVGSAGVIALPNGNYLVSSFDWDVPNQVSDVGAVTWGNGATGTSGVLSIANSLIGTTQYDRIGTIDFAPEQPVITVLANSNYVIQSAQWDDPDSGKVNVGAVTWGNGKTGTFGRISSANSFVGSEAWDQVGYDSGNNLDNKPRGVTALRNGNYVFESVRWHDNKGAVTWGDGNTGSSGIVSSANSFVGASDGDSIGGRGVYPLSNGHYVIASPSWDASPEIQDAGAVTWGDGTTGGRGVVSAANSLVGGKSLDYVGFNGVVALSNGNYVVSSNFWSEEAPAPRATGAVTWGDGARGSVGVVSESNSLTGSIAGFVTALSNGNYVVCSNGWNDPVSGMSVGAVTFGNGMNGTVGKVSAANSLLGARTGDLFAGYVLALRNGNYLVAASSWDETGVGIDAGAVAWGNGRTGLIGRISASNALIGTQAGQRIGTQGTLTRVLANDNYLISSTGWNGAASSVGALTWGDGNGGTTGYISAQNSLVGTTANDQVGTGFAELDNGGYAVFSQHWDNAGIVDAGALTFSDGRGVRGAINANNSILGRRANSFPFSAFDYDRRRDRFIVGRSTLNVVTIFTLQGDALFSNGFE
jgi:hypothetical protein